MMLSYDAKLCQGSLVLLNINYNGNKKWTCEKAKSENGRPKVHLAVIDDRLLMASYIYGYCKIKMDSKRPILNGGLQVYTWLW